jgi:hypothetical protein
LGPAVLMIYAHKSAAVLRLGRPVATPKSIARKIGVQAGTAGRESDESACAASLAAQMTAQKETACQRS